MPGQRESEEAFNQCLKYYVRVTKRLPPTPIYPPYVQSVPDMRIPVDMKM